MNYQTNEKQVFLIDDVIGKYNLSPNLLEKWEMINEKLVSCLEARQGLKKMVCTLRNQIAFQERFKTASTILNTYVVNLEDKPLSKQEKRNILFNHIKVNDLENEVTEDEVEMICETNFAFPLLFRLIANDKERFRNRILFFKRPWYLLHEELNKMCSQNKKLYCTLVLCMLFNGKLSKTVFDVNSTYNDAKIKKIMQACELETNMSKMELYNSAFRAIGTYFCIAGETITFIHDALEETISYHFCQRHPREMLTECDFLFIRDRVNVHYNKNVDENIVAIREKDLDKDYLRPIYVRFLNELMNGKFANVLMSQLIKNTVFVRKFVTVIKQTPTISIRNLLNRVSTDRMVIRINEFESVLNMMIKKLFKSNKNFQNQTDAIDRALEAIESRGTLIYFIVAFGCYEFFQISWSELTHVEKRRLLGRDYFPPIQVKSFFPLAVLGGNFNIVSKLISDGADVNCFSEFLETPLYIAAKSEKYEIVRMLVESGATVNLRAWFCMKVPIAVAGNKPDFISLFLEHDSQQTELHLAVLDNDLEKMRSSIRSFNIDSKTKSGWTCLHYAVALRNVEDVEVMFDEVTAINNHRLVLEENTNLPIKMSKPNINIPDINGLTAIHLAVINDDIETVTVLLRYGADVNVRDYYDRSPLHYTTSVRTTKVLLAHQRKYVKTDLEAEEQQEYRKKPSSPLVTICRNITLQTVFRCLFRDFVNMPDKDGNTPLHSAVNKKRDDIVEVLLQNGADPFLFNNTRYTPVQFIEQRYENGKYTIDRAKQSSNTKKFIYVMLFFIVVSTVLSGMFLTKSENVLCYADHLGHLNRSVKIYFSQLNKSFPFALYFLSAVTGLCPLLSCHIKYSTYLMCVETVFIFVPYIFFLYSYMYDFDIGTFMYYFCSLVIAFYLLIQLLSREYFSLLKDISWLRYRMFTSRCIMYIVSIFICIFSMVITFYVIFNIPDLLSTDLSDCYTFNLTHMYCVGPGYNETFQNITDSIVDCYNGTLTVGSNNFVLPLYYAFLRCFYFLFYAICGYCCVNCLSIPKQFDLQMRLFVICCSFNILVVYAVRNSNDIDQ